MTQLKVEKQSFGGCTFERVSPPVVPQDGAVPKKLNFSISFEEALKLHLALGECLSKLNKYNRSTTAGRRTAVLLTAHLDVNRLGVLEGKLSL
jgi:hypothetical protein